MQPYFFPYLGYFQLAHAADTFVFYDDVNFIKNGWINRNRLLLDGKPHYFTVPLAGASPFAPILETRFAAQDLRWRGKMIATFAQAYTGAPCRAQGMALLETALAAPTDSIAELARTSVTTVLGYLGLERRIVVSSRVYENAHLHGEERVLDICRRESALTYINAPGGRALYNNDKFERAGVQLRYLEGRLPPYPQPRGAFVPGLSILDAAMRCSRDQLLEMTADYSLAP